MRILELEYPELPSTTNKLYIRGSILSKTAREYKSRFKEYMTREYLPELSVLGDTKKDKTTVYCVHLRFFFETLVNETFEDEFTPPSKRAKDLYKRLDLSNRIKLVEDCVKDLIQIDDSRTFAATQEKLMDPQYQRVEIFIDQLDPEAFGIPSKYLKPKFT